MKSDLYKCAVRACIVFFGLFILPSYSVVAPKAARAFEAGNLESMVSVLPLWPGMERGGTPEIPPGTAPEGTAVAVLPGGYLITALHVVDQALEISVRLSDGRELPAEVAGRDSATDLALLRISEDLPLLKERDEVALGEPVCAVGNQFGLGLSVSCGVVSGLRRSGTGFNPIEDFLQTDAAVNPGSSGGALLDAKGRLVGILSAIFASDGDSNIGVNFAVSMPLARRVAEDLVRFGQVVRGRPGMNLAELDREERQSGGGVRIRGLRPGGAAEKAGLLTGDVITAIDTRRVTKISDAIAAIHLKRPGDQLSVTVERGGDIHSFELTLAR